jgi:hypothetical protein
MTADRFGPTATGEYTAVRSMRTPAPDPDAVPADPYSLPGPGSAEEAAGTAPGARRSGRVRRWVPVLPPQHGAWAFLVVPVLVGFAVAGATAPGWLLLAAWVCAYPVGYYGGRALSARVRRGSWTRVARRELGRAVPWMVLTGLLGLPLLLTRPWLLLAGAALALLWALGLLVAARRGERSMANDLLLVAQAVAAVPLTVAVVAGPGALSGALARDTATATVLVSVYLAGSVLHVKSLIREAGSPAFRRLNLGWHVGAAVLAAAVTPWWLLGFGPALLRAVVLRPGLRPAVIGGIEAIVSVLMVVAALLAV